MKRILSFPMIPAQQVPSCFWLPLHLPAVQKISCKALLITMFHVFKYSMSGEVSGNYGGDDIADDFWIFTIKASTKKSA
jgi:hypothetical protein